MGGRAAKIGVAVCAECGGASSADWRGWQAHLVDHPVSFEPPLLVFYCPACAFGEFGPLRRSEREENA